MVINTNVSAIYSSRMLDRNGEALQKDLEKLSSGLRINRGADDPVGLAISEKMKSQISGLNQASRNAADGISLIQTAEGYLQETHNLLQRIRVLSVQAANGIYNDDDRQQSQYEVDQLVEEVSRIAGVAQFNEIKLLDGSLAGEGAQAAPAPAQQAPAPEGDQAAVGAAPEQQPAQGATTTTGAAGPLIFHVGANVDERIFASIGAADAASLGIENVSVSDQESANQAIATLDNAVKMVSSQRANLGAYQNRLESTVRSLDIGAENLSASNSRVRDANMAKESVAFVRDTILNQSTTAMLAQANAKNQGVLQLLQ